MVLERLSPHLAQIKVLHKVFCTGVAEVPPETPNVVRASHLLNTLYKAIIEYDSTGEASEQTVESSSECWAPSKNLRGHDQFSSFLFSFFFFCVGGLVVLAMDRDGQTVFGDRG